MLKEYWDLGIGRELVRTLIEWAKSTGVIRKVNLRVRPDNARALKLYKRFGFVEQGRISREYFNSSRFYDNLIMGLEID